MALQDRGLFRVGRVAFLRKRLGDLPGIPGRAYLPLYKARCQSKQWRQDELELKITSMELLPDVKEKLIEKITILIPLGVLNKALVTELAELTKERPGTTELYFKVTDPESKMTLDLVSRPVKLSVGRGLISYLKERPELDFSDKLIIFASLMAVGG